MCSIICWRNMILDFQSSKVLCICHLLFSYILHASINMLIKSDIELSIFNIPWQNYLTNRTKCSRSWNKPICFKDEQIYVKYLYTLYHSKHNKMSHEQDKLQCRKNRNFRYHTFFMEVHIQLMYLLDIQPKNWVWSFNMMLIMTHIAVLE